jgi:membrane protease subunit HflK
MPWNSGGPNPWGGSGDGAGNDGGGGNRPRSPWNLGGGGGGNNGRGPRGPSPMPDLEAILARLQAALRRLLPGGGAGGRGLVLIAAVLAVFWLGSGFYRVQPDEQGIVLRFGAFNRATLPGLNYHWPWPVETVLLPAVTHINRIEIGFRSSGNSDGAGGYQAGTAVLPESLMLTGDENIIDINVAVFWRIRDPVAYLFNTRSPQATIKAVSESAMREVIGRTPIQPALTGARAAIEQAVTAKTQATLDSYQSGVEITQVQLQKVDPPAEVVESFRDVQRANTDAERKRNQAEAYRNDIVPRARGDAARLVAEAEGAKQASIVSATGETQRFLSVLSAYEAAPAVTMRRMYIETMQDVLAHSPAVVVDDGLKGVVPFLPLGTGTPSPSAPPTNPAPSAPPKTGPSASADQSTNGAVQ